MEELDEKVLKIYVKHLSPKSRAAVLRLAQDVERAGNMEELDSFLVEFEFPADVFIEEVKRQSMPNN